MQHCNATQLQGPVPCKEQASQEDKGEHAKRMPELTRHTRQLWFHGKYNTCTYSSVLVRTAIRGVHAATAYHFAQSESKLPDVRRSINGQHGFLNSNGSSE